MLKVLSKYPEELKFANQLYSDVEASHRGLGKLVLFDALSDIANRCVLVVGCAGTGKSRASDLVFEKCDRSKLKIDSVTVSGLRKIQNALSWNFMSIVVDDLSKGQTEYSQIATVSVFSTLCYTGQIVKLTGQLELSIQGFRGCALINLQPLLLRKIARLPEFETDIRDKAVRFYHLYFPVNENIEKPKTSVSYRYLKELNLDIKESDFEDDVFENFRYMFSKARAREHMNAYLNASAILNRRSVVTDADFELIYELSKIFRLEQYILVKRGLEGIRELDENILPLLSAIATFKAPSVKELSFRFGIKKTRLYEIIQDLTDYCILVKNSGKIIPTDYTREILRECGVW
jgi:hypothetical protein